MAARFWINGNGDWNTTNTANWSSSSGGASGASVPTSADDVTFDLHSNEATDAAYTCTSDSITINCKSLDVSFTGTTKVTLAGNFGRMNIWGNLNLSGGTAQVIWSYTSQIFFCNNATITTNGVTLNSSILLFLSGITLTLGSNLVTTSDIYLYSTYSTLTVSASNYTITAGKIYISYATATLTLGSGTHTLTGYSFDNSLGGTITASTGTIKLTNTSNATYYFQGGGKTYNNIWFSRGTSTGTNTITGSNTFADFKDDGTEAHTDIFTDGTIQTITSLTVNGSAGKLITLTGTSSAGWSISDTTGTNTVTYCNIAYSTAEGGATWKALSDTNVNGGNNTGWVFYDPFTNPGNIYSSNNVYATLPATSGVLTVEISKDAGVNWLVAKTVTFTGTDTLQTCGTGSTELWGASFTRADMVDANFRVRLTHGGGRQVYKTFGFATGTDILTGIEIAIEGKYASPTMSLDLLEVKIYYGTSTLVVQAGSQAYDSTNGTLAVYDGANWVDIGAPPDLSGYAPLASPALTGSPTLPTGTIATTQAANDNSTKLATTAYADLQATNVNANIYRQAIINGNFDVWQRGTSIALTTTDDYTADRWYAQTQTTATDKTVSRQDGTGVNGSYYSARVLAAQDVDELVTFSYAMESQESIKFRGSKVTLSFYAKGGAEFVSGNATLVSKIVTGKGTDQKVLAFTTSADGVSQNNTLTTGWQKFTCTTTAVIASDITQIGISFSFTHAGTGVTTNYFEVTQVQLNAGSVALPFMPKSYAEELRDCMRYYEIGDADWLGYAVSGSFETNWVRFTVQKRIDPTVVQTTVSQDGFGTTPGQAVVNSLSFRSQRQATATGNTKEFLESWTASAEL